MVILGFGVLLVPSIASEPNLRGLPTIPLALFMSALVLYAVFENRHLMLYAMLILLLPTLGYSGFWAYCYKMPLSSLKISMRIHHVHVSAYGDTTNMSLIEIGVTVLNPSNVDTPLFAFENLAAYINDMKLADGYAFGFGSMRTLNGEPIFLPFTVIKAHESLNITLADVKIFQDRLQVEKGSSEDTWNVLLSRDFTLKITGAFTSRPDYETEVRMFSLWILATSPFQMSEKFSES